MHFSHSVISLDLFVNWNIVECIVDCLAAVVIVVAVVVIETMEVLDASEFVEILGALMVNISHGSGTSKVHRALSVDLIIFLNVLLLQSVPYKA